MILTPLFFDLPSTSHRIDPKNSVHKEDEEREQNNYYFSKKTIISPEEHST